MEINASDSNSNENLSPKEMLSNFEFHLLNSVSYLEDDRVRRIGADLTKFTELEEFYASHQHDYLSKSINFISRLSNFFMKDNKVQLMEELSCLTVKIVNGIKRSFHKNQFDDKHKPEIEKILKLITLLLESHEMDFQIEGSRLLIATIDVPFMQFPNFRRLFLETCQILKYHRRFSNLGRLFYAVINRKVFMGRSRGDLTPSFLYLEKECLSCFSGEVDDEAVEEIIRCLVLLYNHKKFDFSTEIKVIMPLTNKICCLIHDSDSRKFVEQLLSQLIVKTKFFDGTNAHFLKQIRKLPDSYEEWPGMKEETFILICYFLLMTSELLWSNQVILDSICSYVEDRPNISNNCLKAILMLYPLMIQDISDQSTIDTGETILSHLRNNENLRVILTPHALPLMWIFTNADDSLTYKILECWFQMESNAQEIANIFGELKMGHILINYYTICSNELLLHKISGVIIKLEREEKTSQAIHLAILKMGRDINKLEVLLTANFDVPEEPNTISKHLEILYLILPILNQKASIIGGCNYLNRLMGSFDRFGVNVRFEEDKLNLLIPFLLSVCCLFEDDLVTAASTLLTTLLESDQLNTEVYIGSPLMVPFRKIIVGSSQRINCGVELFHRILNQNNFVIVFCDAWFLELYKYLFQIVSDETIYAILKLLKVLCIMDPQLSHSVPNPQAMITNVLSEESLDLLKIYFRFARGISR